MGLRIGICDDDHLWCENVINMLNAYGRQQALELEVSAFDSGEMLRKYEGEVLNILFMDIRLDGENGIELAGQINDQWPDCQIIYLTQHYDYAMDVYRTRHIYFAVKECFGERLEEIMEHAQRQLYLKQEKIVTIIHGREKINFLLDELLYFEREKRITKIITTRGEFVTSEKISSLIERLPGMEFVRCHNSYIVYLPAVEKYMRNIFLMRDGRKILISRGYREQTRKAFDRWAGM